MALSSGQLSPEVHEYVVAHSTGPDGVLEELAAETLERFPGSATMQIAPEQGSFMTLLPRMIGARSAVEVGTFTGYSSLCLARGLGADGRLLCCDVSEEWTSVARRYWDKAGVGDRIELRLAPALDTLRELSPDVVFDLAFIDADKSSYVAYWEELVPRIRSGGVLLVDNTLWSGAVADPGRQDDAVRAIRMFNDHVAADDRVEQVILPIGDGLTLARRH
ncbi:O-methyltransferase [Actinomadura rudentiformis]|uniref:SAM-dependent methyltransferase n=1 Tax=Actinomadura rudentiformis TaxID=359158 RepID=A0A6H9YYB2_9ACTN|nr:O-methyltransferase [Actinomadura rudentiformis]KAB2347737.1 SAM-dependent methyltransferase [Actinomadura rudentiformis]